MDIDCPDCSGCDANCDIPCKKRIQRTCDNVGCTTCGENGKLGRFFLSMLATSVIPAHDSTSRRERRRRAAGRVSAWFGVAAIRGYQRYISPRLATRCRYVPTCSTYGIHAIRHYGLIRGSRLAAGRILRCTPAVGRGTADPITSPVVVSPHA